MRGFRADIIGHDGHIVCRVDLFCAGDDQAKDRAKLLIDGHPVELWDGDRLIVHFKPVAD